MVRLPLTCYEKGKICHIITFFIENSITNPSLYITRYLAGKLPLCNVKSNSGRRLNICLVKPSNYNITSHLYPL